MMDFVPVTAIVAAYDRADATRKTIRRLQACDPPPGEILVHLDSGAVFDIPDGVRVLRSPANIGPGGGRNRMIREASYEWVASFDDDSYPEDLDYFGRLSAAILRHSKAGILASSIRHLNPIHDAAVPAEDREVASFVGCGCTYRKSAFMKTSGYVPLPVAYGMEEVDLALQMHASGIDIIEVPELRVFHETNLLHHDSARITAGAIMNQALLAWVRYPVQSFAYGFLQYANKVWDSLKRGRVLGVLLGIVGTPKHLWRHRNLRAPVSPAHLKSFLELRHRS